MKTKLTNELLQKMIEDIELGLNYKDVCKLNLISEDSFYEWVRRGAKDLREQKKTIFSEFSESFEAARLKLKKTCLEAISKDILDSSKGISDTKTAIWYLQTKYKKEYGSLATGDADDLILVNQNIDKSLTPLNELKEQIKKLRESNANQEK